jgi:antitoxin component of RelBE/YafQ-DinJ toxin-antitoxin module
MNAATALNMFVKTVLRTRELPFAITDVEPQEQKKAAFSQLKEAFQEAQTQ